MSQTVLVVGTGALGTLFAARLTTLGIQVTMLGTWKAALEALQDHGAWVVTPEGARLGGKVKVTTAPEACSGIPRVLVLVKSWQTARVARQLAACLPPDGLALTLQNGLSNDELLALHLGGRRVAIGVTTTGASLLEPGLARDGGQGRIDLGAHPRLLPLADLLQEAGFPITIHPDVRALQWGKLVVNAAINPLTALLEEPNGALLQDPAALLFLHRAAEEVASVANGLNITLPYPDPRAVVEDVARRTATNISSMLQDLRRDAPTEVEAINGEVVRFGRETGIETPLNHALLAMVKEKVQSRKIQ
jgi:2-dehydropantoate 2-reductase